MCIRDSIDTNETFIVTQLNDKRLNIVTTFVQSVHPITVWLYILTERPAVDWMSCKHKRASPYCRYVILSALIDGLFAFVCRGKCFCNKMVLAA